MNKVAIYVRVSTTNQAEEGYSIDEQIDKLKAYCKIKDWTVYKVFKDAGFTGSNIDRPGMTKLVNAAKKKQFDTVLVYKLDRLSRSQKDTLFLIEEVFIKNGIDFVSLSENFDTASAFGKAMIGILSVFAQLEREQIKERMMLGKVGRAKSGKSMMWSKAAYGYNHNKETDSLEIVESEAVIVRKIYDLYLAGKSITKLRDYLNENKLLVNKTVNWSYKSTRDILNNPVYCGMIRYDGNLYDGIHEPIISKEKFDIAQSVLKERQMDALTKSNPRPFKAKYMLSGLARCGYCGAPLTVILGMKRKDGTRYKKYECKNRFPRKTKPVTIYNENKKCDSGFYYMEELENAVLNEIQGIQDNISMLDKIFDTETDFDEENALADIKKIDAKISKLNDLYINDLIGLDELRSKTENLITEKKILDKEIENNKSLQNNHMKNEARKILNSKNIIEMSYADQSYVIKSLVQKVDVTAEQVKLVFKK